MAITTAAQFNDALRKAQIIPFQKSSISSTAANFWFSSFRAGGWPVAGSIPTAAAICNNTLTGGQVYRQAVGSNKLYLAEMEVGCSQAYMDIQLHDRLAHMGGLVANITTLQTTNLPIDVSGTESNLVARRGAVDYSELQWWFDIYTTTGATQSTVTITYVATDDTTDTFATTVIPANANAGRSIPINYPPNGKIMKRINSVQLSPSTGTAGNFGITVTRPIGGISTEGNNIVRKGNAYVTGFPSIQAEACLYIIYLCSATSSGTVAGRLVLAEG